MTPLLLLLAGEASGQCTPTSTETSLERAGDQIGLIVEPSLRSVAQEAVAFWESCPEYGRGFPAFVIGPVPGARTVLLGFRRHSGSGACGLFTGHRVQVFAFAGDRDRRSLYCGPSELVLAHELGHVLGLGHPLGDGCQRHVMTNIDRFNRNSRQVQDSECQMAARLWLTLDEQRLLAAGHRQSSDEAHDPTGEG